MTRRFELGTMVMAATLAISGVASAQPAAIRVPVNAIFSKAKTSTVKFTLRNDTQDTMHLTAAGNPVTLDAGKSLDLKLNEGEKVVATETTAHYAAGDVIVTASKSLSDASVVLR